MDTIGSRIKSLRIEQKLSQSQLAGDQMTKGMLSQIENNQAMPSMKSLRYIANQLGKPVSYFLQEDRPPQAVEKTLDEINAAIKKCKGKAAIEQAARTIETLEGVLREYKLDTMSKAYADILLLQGTSLTILNRYDEGEGKIREAIEIYIQQRMLLDAAKASLELGNRYLDQFAYEECLRVIGEAEELYGGSPHRDNEFESELLYLKAYIQSAMGNIQESLALLNQAIRSGNDRNVYYRPEEMHRMAAVLYYYDEKYEDFLQYIKKARQFAELTENTTGMGRVALNVASYELDMGRTDKAVEQLSIYEKHIVEKRYLYYVQKARAFYQLGQYEEALRVIRMVPYNTFVNHKFDYLFLWSGKVHEGLILHKLGRSSEGLEEINTAVQKLAVFPPSRVLAFAYRSLGEIYSGMGDYENAYKSLKTANEMNVQ